MPTLQIAKGGVGLVAFPQSDRVSDALRSAPYNDIYQDLVSSRAYNVRFPGGAIMQLMYAFSGRRLLRHRLAFFASPQPEEQEDPTALDGRGDDFDEGEMFVGGPLPLAVRFDYDFNPETHQEITHPKCHLTLGQNENCRIPVTAPLTPNLFVDFVLRNLYEAEGDSYNGTTPSLDGNFSTSMTALERKIIHIGIPT